MVVILEAFREWVARLGGVKLKREAGTEEVQLQHDVRAASWCSFDAHTRVVIAAHRPQMISQFITGKSPEAE
jgi:hypothetical protein